MLYDDEWDVNGFVGYLESDKSIYVTFRGTDSDKNMAMDLNIVLAPYTMWPECASCTVHAGFQEAYLQTADQALSEVRRL